MQSQPVAPASSSLAYRQLYPSSESAQAAYHHQTYRTTPIYRNIFRASYLDNFHQAPHYNVTMGTIPPSSNVADPDHMAEFQKLSNHYEPHLQGPLVGPKQSSSMITSEYANADPIYVAKTTASCASETYTAIAVAFGYFETLFNLRDTAKLERELARIKSLNDSLDSIGCQKYIYEMFVEVTEDVFGQILGAIAEGSYDDSFLLDAFNDESQSSAIITHFRLMTSAWMKKNPDRYAGFLRTTVDDYRTKTIEPGKTEIDEIGIHGLFDGVIEGSGFAIEILYLDRSEGTEVTPHLLSPDNPIATIRLLYRPGHYDLLYQTNQAIHNQGITSVNFQYAMSSDYMPWFSSALPFDLNPVLMSIPSLPLDTTSISSPMPSSQPYAFPERQINSNIPPQMIPQSPPAPAQPSPISSFPVSPDSTPDKSTELQIRMNPLVCEPMNTLPLPSVPFSNSPSNLAHFHHPDFQPSQWDPNEEYK
ncbi:hypothetical protein EMPG_11952 [Blastomyces silverae]|uniref:ubiquitinyl hydrolase 1 n=1 Tax=Blastomyces silverae TaxID=2060906 RepID=A0A0H1BVJ7_9EURO|nr:hypothetical protein EMPG_11952 [Blastomyces silverae]